jgi:hypothetical protein
MSGNPREHIRNKGFWEGGAPGQGSNREHAGRTSGAPGERKPSRVGTRTDLEFPETEKTAK